MTGVLDAVARATVRLDVADVAPTGCRALVADVLAAPVLVRDPAVVLVCLPGGGMSRRYFDLDVAGADGAYSLAVTLASRGFVVLTLDHPGVGDSDVPDDPWSLTPEVVADVEAAAVARALAGLRRGSLVDRLPPLPDLVPIGLGHSMGALLTVYQQARHHTSAAIALLGFGARGMGGGEPEVLRSFLSEEELRFVGDPAGLRREIVSLARTRFGTPLPRGGTTASELLLGGMDVPDDARRALDEAGAALLAVCGLTSMITGTSDEEIAAVDVPVFVGVGEHDIAGEPTAIPGAFTGTDDVTLYVLPGAGHNHNVAPNRDLLWDQLAAWCRKVVHQ